MFGITAGLIKASQSDKGAFVKALSFEMEQGMIDLKQDINRQLGWSGTGALATVSANAISSSTITVTGRESTEDGNKFIPDAGIVVDVLSGSTIVASGIGVTSVSGTSTATLVLDAPVTVSANDILIRSGSNGNEIQGVLYSMDGATSSIYSVDRSVYTSYQGNVLNCNGGQLTLDLMQQAYNEGLRRGNAKYAAIMSDYNSLRYYQKLLTPDRRYVNTKQGDGTFSEKDKFYLEFSGLPIVPDKDFPTRIAFLDGDSWIKYVLGEPLEWAEESGSMMIPQTSSDQFEVRLRLFMNLFNDKPASSSLVRNYISP